MYQPYPTGAQLPEVEKPTVPAQVKRAVTAMYVGAAATVAAVVIEILTVNATKAAIEKRSPHLTVSQVNATQHALIIGSIVSGLIAVAAWLVIARACKNGHNWARITGTALFGLATIDTIGSAISRWPGQGLVARHLAGRADRGDLPLAAPLHRILQGRVALMIEVDQLVKRFGAVTAVDGLTFAVRPGHVTGFLGPNGAGKTTTMRLILGLDAPTSGTARVNQKNYQELIRPLHQVGALLDATALHPGRTAEAHLAAIAQSNGIRRGRVTEMLQLTGLEAVANRRLKGFSLGMKQRLGIAAALLGDPPVLMFDEPVNGLDTEGIAWIRQFLKALAADGRTVLVSSHLMSEMAQTADRLIVIGRGRLIADTTTTQLIESSTRRDVLVRSPRAGELAELMTARGATVHREDDGALAVTGLDAAAVGDLAAEHGIAVHALIPRTASLEDAYLDLTGESTDFRAAGPPTAGPETPSPETPSPETPSPEPAGPRPGTASPNPEGVPAP